MTVHIAPGQHRTRRCGQGQPRGWTLGGREGLRRRRRRALRAARRPVLSLISFAVGSLFWDDSGIKRGRRPRRHLRWFWRARKIFAAEPATHVASCVGSFRSVQHGGVRLRWHGSGATWSGPLRRAKNLWRQRPASAADGAAARERQLARRARCPRPLMLEKASWKMGGREPSPTRSAAKPQCDADEFPKLGDRQGTTWWCRWPADIRWRIPAGHLVQITRGGGRRRSCLARRAGCKCEWFPGARGPG